MGPKILKILEKIKRFGFEYWLPFYFWGLIGVKEKPEFQKPIHLMVCLVDHFEPFHGGVNFGVAKKRVEFWRKSYPEMADRFRDADGNPPQHTWFYPPHLNHCFLEDLVMLCQSGFGEIEMHLHHNHMEPFPDTPETLKEKILKCISDYSQWGVFCLPNGDKKFGFVHGDWSLDNALGAEICGVNNEIDILRECGCYGDFTFPSLGKAQPSMFNCFYMAKGHSGKSKSYNRGVELRRGVAPSDGLLMLPGIIGLRAHGSGLLKKYSIEDSGLDGAREVSKERVEYWVRNSLAVKGRPNWRFIKLHVHGAVETTWDNLLGNGAQKIHNLLSSKFNDGKKYVLHYVSSREMFNIVRASLYADGENPNDYRDSEIPKYIYLG